MWRRGTLGTAAIVALFSVMFSVTALAQGLFKTRLTGYEEVPAVSSPGSGKFTARIRGGSIQYSLSYSGLNTEVLQAHIHLGAMGTNGAVSVFLCSNVGAPAGTPGCPQAAGTVDGMLGPSDVIGPAGQGISAGEFDELVAAIREGVTYVNVHTAAFPGGEIRGQIGRGLRGGHDNRPNSDRGPRVPGPDNSPDRSRGR